MARPTLGVTALDATVNVRLTLDEKARLQLDADIAGIGMSELVRARYFGRKIVANTDLATIRHLNRLGALLKHVHNESHGAYSKDTADAVRAITDFIEKLAAK